MSSIKSTVIQKHTTSSSPSPHVLYIITVTLEDGHSYEIMRRYSQFVKLQHSLKDMFPLPPRHSFASAIRVSNRIKDSLISERKAGLSAYLSFLLNTPGYREHGVLKHFLSPQSETNAMSKLPQMVYLNKAVLNTSACPPTVTTQSIIASYYPSWCADDHPPESLDFSKFDVLFYAFAIPTSSGSLHWDDDSRTTLERLVACVRGSNCHTKIVLSIGGWDGCSWWSNVVSSEENRQTFNQALVSAVEELDLDGIDIDWEYPNSSGAGHPFSPSDAQNLLELMKLLRNSLGDAKIISAAVTHHPWLGQDGNPLNDVSAYAKIINYVSIMNYDVFGASANPGPNSPLGNPCGTSQQPDATAQAALDQWLHAGMPANKLLLGLPLYGYVSKSISEKLHGSSSESQWNRKGAHRNYKLPVRRNGDLSMFWGQQIPFNQLLGSGALVKMADGSYDGAEGYIMSTSSIIWFFLFLTRTTEWDDCSDTPVSFESFGCSFLICSL
ncbi:hypothetical protein AX14_010033 [Amanita brunnescens Koide BX004]|nr:hypothetical protein AX14_010033 [Amanita brunnescens Koide BX004]